jgi:hypothetical protein
LRVLVDGGAAHPEKTRDLRCVDEWTPGGRRLAQSLREEVGEMLELVVLQAEEQLCHRGGSSAWQPVVSLA